MKLYCPYGGCDRVFASNANLEYHINTHKNIKPYVCSYPKCKAAFKIGYLLRCHVNKIHGGKHGWGPSDSMHRSKTKDAVGNVVTETKNEGNIKSKEEKSSSPSNCNLTVKKKTSFLRSLHVQIRPEDLNQVRKYRQLKESLFWKRSMHHLFMVPFKVINPEFSKDSNSIEFWYSPNVLPYRGFIPISKLPEELRVIHESNMYLNRVNRGWESALTISSESAKFRKTGVDAPAVQPSAVTNNGHSLEPHKNVSCQSVCSPTSSKFLIGSRDCRLCPYCKKILSKERYYVHLATHRGHGFKFHKCSVCGLRFLNSTSFSEHLQRHSSQHVVSEENYLYDGMPLLTPVIL